MHVMEVDMTIWWVASVTPPLKNPGYAPVIHFWDRRGEASLRHRNRTEITMIIMCEKKPCSSSWLSKKSTRLLSILYFLLQL